MLILAAPETSLPESPSSACQPGQDSHPEFPDPLLQSDSKTTRKAAFLIHLAGVNSRCGSCSQRNVKAPALQAQSPRTPRGQIQVMGHQNRGEPVGYVQSFQKLKNSPGCRLVQIAGWFVGQQKPRIANQSPGQRNPLLLPA